MQEIRIANSHDLAQAEMIYNSAMRIADWLPEPARNKFDFGSATMGEDIFVAVNSDRLITGFVSVWTAESFIHHLYVDAAFRRSGVGSELLASLHNWLPRPWKLKCVTANSEAMAFYLSLGWVSEKTENGPDGEYHLMRFA